MEWWWVAGPRPFSLKREATSITQLLYYCTIKSFSLSLLHSVITGPRIHRGRWMDLNEHLFGLYLGSTFPGRRLNYSVRESEADNEMFALW